LSSSAPFGRNAPEGNSVVHVSTPRATPAAIPYALQEAMHRAAQAEQDLERVYPLFATKAGAQAEMEAFAAEIRDAHRDALSALKSWTSREGTHEDAAKSYERLARAIERFASRAGLDASELDS
jgi:hypothetical protein